MATITPGSTAGMAATQAVKEKTTSQTNASDYWKANVRLLLILLAVWFTVSFGFGILLVEPLNAIQIGGFKLGFWFAQQGAIYVFVALIFVYSALIKRVERSFGVED